MVLDSNNNPRIVYSGANGLLYYASSNGSTWKIQTVIQGGTPISLALDSNGNPHILYTGANGVTYYASWDGTNWSFLAVPDGFGYSLALDSVGNPHIAYAHQLLVSEYPSGVTDNICMLNYASWNGTSWNVETVDKPISNTDTISLALDSHNNPHIMYGYDTYYPPSGGYTATAKIATWNGSRWDFQTALSNLDHLGSITLDSNGYPHFVYEINYPHESLGNTTLGYASWNGVTWSSQTVVSNVYVPGLFIQTYLALDTHNNPHVEFFNGSLMYASYTGNAWNTQTVAPDNFAYAAGPLALDSNGNPYICYWVDDIHNTTAFVSALIFTTQTPSATQPQPTSTSTVAPLPQASVSKLWSSNSNWSIVQSPLLADGLVYVTSGSSGGGTLGLYCLNASTGTEVWSHNGFFSTFSVANGYVYVGEANYGPSNSLVGVVSCLNASTGANVWNYSVGSSFGIPVVADGIVYTVGYNYTLSTDVNIGFIYAFNASTGEKLWSFTGSVGTRFGNGLVLAGTDLYVLSAVYSSKDASWRSGVYAFDASTGNELWNYTSPGQFGSFTAAGQNLFVTSNFVDTRNNLDAEKSGGYVYEGGVIALNALKGTKVWNYSIGSSVGTPLVVNNTVYAVSGDGTLYAFNATDGEVVWNYNAGTGLGSLLSVNGYLYVGSSSGVYCLNAGNGAVIWNFAVSDFAGSSPTLPTYADGIIYVGWNGPMSFSPVTQHNFYALEASNGEKLWNYTLGYTVMSQPLIEGGTVYIDGSFVTSRSPDFESSGAVLALKPNVTSLPLPPPSSPSSTPPVPELSWVILPLLMISVLVTDLYLKRKLKTR